MKRRLLELLVAPGTQSPFACTAFVEEGDEILQGVLQVSDSSVHYPIVNGVPVILDYAYELYPDFLEEYRDRLPPVDMSSEQLAVFREKKAKTIESFGFEWSVYTRLLDKRDTGYVFEGDLTAATFEQRLLLEGGCGYGRHTAVVSEFEGTEVVGVDLSYAVNSAYKLVGSRPNVHIVQGDIFNLPFARETFDGVYSWGVLHHTGDCERAVRSLIPLVKPGGLFSTKIYSHLPAIRQWNESALRAVTTKLPVPTLYKLCKLAWPLWFCYEKLGLKHIPILSHILRAYIRPDPDWQICHIDTFDWYHPQYQEHIKESEVVRWYREEGLTEIRPRASCGVHAKRKLPEQEHEEATVDRECII